MNYTHPNNKDCNNNEPDAAESLWLHFEPQIQITAVQVLKTWHPPIQYNINQTDTSHLH